MKMIKIMNPFKRLSTLEKRQSAIEVKLENMYKVIIASCIIQNIHPKLLQEHALDMTSLANYLIEMTNDEKDK